MSLRRSPRLTPAVLAANRANARKSTGPRSERGKARAGLNGLKHGRYAVDLAQRLARAGYPESEARWHAIRARIAQTFGPVLAISSPVRSSALARSSDPAPSPVVKGWRVPGYRHEPNQRANPQGLDTRDAKKIDRMANWVWCSHRSWQQHFGPKPECSFKSAGGQTVHSNPSMNWATNWRSSIIHIHHPWARIGLVFYTQRRRGWRHRQLVALAREALRFDVSGGPDPDAGREKPPDLDPEMESGLRSRAYLLARPREWEQLRYCLDRKGRYHPEWQGRYRKLRQEMRDAGQGVWLEPHPILTLERLEELKREAAARPPGRC